MKKQFYLFDLDGTLTDPKEGITKSVEYALKRYGISPRSLDELECFIGPPLLDCFMGFYGFSENQAREAIGVYRERFADIGVYENVEYPGVHELLSSLRDAGKRLVIATSKPLVFANIVLRHFGLDGYFAFVSGSELDGTRSSKAEVIEYALENAGVTDRSLAVMIGDRRHDVEGAKAAGLPCVGVLYGFGGAHELEAAGADYIVGDIDELRRLLLDLG